MHQNSSPGDSLAQKWDFLQKYNSVPKIIKPNNSCYAISNDWWANFECLLDIANMEPDMPLGDPGPINNLSILNLNKVYEELIIQKGEGSYPGCPDASVLSGMDDWDNMTLRPNLKYGKDFVIISAFLWKFLKERFGGGPEIEFLPEKRPEVVSPSANILTCENETLLDRNIIINLDMFKIYVTKDSDFASAKAKYVSPMITVQSLLNCLCRDYFLPPHNSVLVVRQASGCTSLTKGQNTLKEENIEKGSFFTTARQGDPILGYANHNSNVEVLDRDDMDSNKANEDEERPLRHQFNEDSDFGGNYSTNSRDSTDSAKLSTGSTNHHLNPLDFSEYMFGDDFPGASNNRPPNLYEMKEFQGGNSSGNKYENLDFKEQPHPNLDVFLKKSKQALDKQKIVLKFKSLQEIKASLSNIQQEWSLWTNNANNCKKA